MTNPITHCPRCKNKLVPSWDDKYAWLECNSCPRIEKSIAGNNESWLSIDHKQEEFQILCYQYPDFYFQCNPPLIKDANIYYHSDKPLYFLSDQELAELIKTTLIFS
jgi:hypothetical protein